MLKTLSKCLPHQRCHWCWDIIWSWTGCATYSI